MWITCLIKQKINRTGMVIAGILRGRIINVSAVGYPAIICTGYKRDIVSSMCLCSGRGPARMSPLCR
jgi:hypothetical protein